jgi:proton glutamate symport protein
VSEPAREKPRRALPGLTAQILIALLLGALIGWLAPELGQRLEILATIFVRLVMAIIAPLIFAVLVVGVAGSGRLSDLGSMALQAVAFFLILSAVAMALGFLLANALQPGVGLAPAAAPAAAPELPAQEPFWVRLFPRSIVDAMARGDVLQIVVFSLLFAAAVAAAGERGKPVLDLCRSLADVMFRFTDFVMAVAPIGVLGAAAALVGKHGLAIGQSFFWLTVTVYLGLGLMLLALMPLLALVFAVPLRGFVRAVQAPFAIAFATTSSAAALPKAMEAMESMGVPRRVVAFVLPVGNSFNLSGGALYIGVASLFVLQAFNQAPALADQFVLFGILYVASKGIANIPRGSLLALAAGLANFGVPAEVVASSFGLLLAIDPILDMPRTGVNITGNCLAAALVARWQGNAEPSDC